MSLLARIFSKPPERWTGPNQQPAAEPPRSLNPLAGNFPQWTDPVTTDLDRDAYIHVRRTEATAQPVQHLGVMMAGRKIQVVSENAEFAEILQTRCVDRMRGVSDAIQFMAWAVVEGVRFCHINGEYDDSDWVIPTLVNGGRRKDKAGGPMLWDGADGIVSKRLDRGAALVSYEETEPASYPRHEWMVWRPGGGDNPEGDTDLGYRLYRLARIYQDSMKSLMVYLERYGIPVTVVKAQLEGLGPDDAAQVLTNAARKAAQMKRGNTVGLDAAQTMDFINPDGTAWQLLIESLRHVGAEAHKAVLMNSTTSDPQAVGPDQRGSSDVHKSVEEAVVEQYCNSFNDTALRDLQRYIEVVNAERLREATREALGNDVLMRIPPWRLRLVPSVAERDIDQTRILDLYNAGVAVKPGDLYGAFGAETPEGVEDVLKKEQQSPFGAFGGFGGERAALSASLAPRELADEALEQPAQPIEAPTQPTTPTPVVEPVKAPAPAPERMEERAPIEELYDSMADEYREVINKAFFAIAEQLERGKPNPKLPEAVLMMNAKANLLAELAGRAEAQAEIEAHHGRPDAYMALAERAAERAAERVNLAEVWRTIGAKNGKGGTPVQIDEETGEIVKGPDQLKGKDADSPEPGASRAGGSDESEAYDYFQDLENELAGDVENGMDVSERLEAIGNDARDMVPGLPDAEARAFARDLGIDAQDLGRDELEDELLAAMDERLRDAAGISESRSTFSRALDAVNSAGFDLATGAIDLAGKALGGAAKLAWRAISSDGVWAVVTDTPLIATPFRLAEIGRRIVMRLVATDGTYEESLPKWFGLVAEDEDRGPIFNASTAERVRLAETISEPADAYRMAEASLIEASIPREWAHLIAPIAVLELGRTQDALTADSLRDLTASVILAADGEMPDDPAEFVREFIADRPDGSGEMADPVAEARERTKQTEGN